MNPSDETLTSNEPTIESLQRQLEEARQQLELSQSNRMKAAMIKLSNEESDVDERSYIDVLLEKLLDAATANGWAVSTTNGAAHDVVLRKGRKTVYAKFDFDVGEFVSGNVTEELYHERDLFKTLSD